VNIACWRQYPNTAKDAELAVELEKSLEAYGEALNVDSSLRG